MIVKNIKMKKNDSLSDNYFNMQLRFDKRLMVQQILNIMLLLQGNF